MKQKLQQLLQTVEKQNYIINEEIVAQQAKQSEYYKQVRERALNGVLEKQRFVNKCADVAEFGGLIKELKEVFREQQIFPRQSSSSLQMKQVSQVEEQKSNNLINLQVQHETKSISDLKNAFNLEAKPFQKPTKKSILS
eukprot:403334694